MTRKITLNEEFERKGMEFWAPVVLTIDRRNLKTQLCFCD